MISFDVIDKRFGCFGAVDIVTRTPYHGHSLTLPITYTLVIELMPCGRNCDQNLDLTTPEAVRNWMYDAAEQIINLAEQNYKITYAPKVEIRGELYWDKWPIDYHILTTGQVTIEFMEKD